MEFFTRYQRQMGYFILIFLVFILQGCNSEKFISDNDIQSETETHEDTTEGEVWEPTYELTEESLLKWEVVKEAETEDFYIVECRDGEKVYPQIVLKEGKDIFCGTEHLNYLFSTLSWLDYNILYADSHYISLWLGLTDEKTGVANRMYPININIQCPVVDSYDSLASIQDDNDYKSAPWPSNGITLSLDDIMKEIERGNCYLDQTAYTLWKENSEEFIESIRRQFKEIKVGDYDTAYFDRKWYTDIKTVYRMYLKEDRVGFYIHPLGYWEENGSEERKPEDSGDFRIEVPYDWKAAAPVYHMTYEVYGQPYEGKLYGKSFQGYPFRTFYYPQIRGLKEEIQSILNENMEKNFKDNLELMTLDKWNERLKDYRGKWSELPPMNDPMVTYQSERYLCIRQDIIMGEANALRYAEEWKRYHVYDLETGDCIKLGDILYLDKNFVAWIKEEKRVEARGEWSEGMKDFDALIDYMKEDLEDYPEDLLLAILEDAEFWIKEGNLYIRLPYYDQQYEVIQYTGMGTDSPPYICYSEARIAVEDLEGFLKVEPW